MRIPAFWAKATAEDVDRRGKTIRFSNWRWSDLSRQDAYESALAAANRVVRRLIAGEQLDCYGYGEMPVREEVLEAITSDEGEFIAAVTQNAYGSLVLNTSRALFIDIDFPPLGAAEPPQGLMAKLFQRRAAPVAARREAEERCEAEARRALEKLLREDPHWSGLLYRTCAGLRVLGTHALFDPTDDATLALLRSVGSDPLYNRLCKQQNSFRARLTPKPWRCGHTALSVRWPRETDKQQRRFERWQAAYDARQTQYATCRFLGVLGSGVVHPQIQPIIELHDRTTRSHEPLPLA